MVIDKPEVHKITHYVGERIYWTVQLMTGSAATNISDCEISYRGQLNDRADYRRDFDLFDNYTVRFRANELVDETADKKLEGRFFFAFPDGSVRVSQEILIAVKR